MGLINRFLCSKGHCLYNRLVLVFLKHKTKIKIEFSESKGGSALRTCLIGNSGTQFLELIALMALLTFSGYWDFC